MSPFAKRSMLFVDTLRDTTGVAERIKELGLSDKEKCPHFDMIVVDSLSITECIREYEHLRYTHCSVDPFVAKVEHVELYVPSTKCTFQRSNVFVVVKWCLDNSISSQITTPVSAPDLASALISALDVSPVSAPNDVIFDILLADDNLVNQKLAVKIPENHSHSVEIAGNGSLAVDAYKAGCCRLDHLISFW
ncbi:hypothetical protein M378DRAFT_12029 [Amanita muscaria Koide BX008]|uniref:Response regulatory domain-containing protein n=1 Tax=Amanita muscaria (strain Koide BX008) TaxID=946122 RepID=A0A0C2WPL9_AMAMK|nr:hypothetical protein M378DRAFT_12029 [Amanita muscaria Koide BX008]